MDLHEDLKFEISIYNINSAYSIKELTFSYDFLTYYETSKGRDISASHLVKDLVGLNITYDCKWTSHINVITENA